MRNFSFVHRLLSILCIALFVFSVFVPSALAQTSSAYQPLTTGFPLLDDNTETNDFAGYVNFIITLIIGLAGILAVLMIIIGGIQYVSTDSWTGKDSGKKRIQAAVGGLILALSSYLILNTIDPSLTYLNFTQDLTKIPITMDANVDIGGTTTVDPNNLDYDIDESGSLDPTGETGGLESGLDVSTGIDSCQGLSEYRASSGQPATDKGKNSGMVVGEIAWLMQVVPQKWPGLTVMSSYRSLAWNLESAYKVKDPVRRKQIIDAFNATDKSYPSRVAIAKQFNLPRAALTSNHVLGEAVDFAGPGLKNGQVDQLVAWARSNPCLKIGEVLWQVSGHYDHVHLGI